MRDRRAGWRLLVVVLPLAAAAAAVLALVRFHAGVLEVARGPRGAEVRPSAERRAMLADGWCAVSRRDRRIVGRLDAPHAPGRPAADGHYPVRRIDVRASARVLPGDVWVVSCPAALRGELPADSSGSARADSVPEALRGICVPPVPFAGFRPPAGARDAGPAAPLVDDDLSAFRLPLRCVVRSEEAWSRVARAGGVALPASGPPVDFSRAVILVASQGEQSSTGYSIRFTRFQAAGDTVYAWVRGDGPGEGESVGDLMTDPAVAVRFPGAPKHVVFIETDG